MKIKNNDIGVAILSTDRPSCLERLLNSIQTHTSLEGFFIHVIDDSSDPKPCENICKEYPWVLFHHTGERIGIAQNTNHAMLSIAKKPYKLIFNNDMEILRVGWEYYYFLAMQQTSFHHFCFQQIGLWGNGNKKKRPETIQCYNDRTIKTIYDHPQGALLAYDQVAFDTVGYFDAELFKSYGRSHWLWSFAISESEIQPKGIHDVVGSNKYFRVHNEPCTTPAKERIESYMRNTKIFEDELQKMKMQCRHIYTPYFE